MDFMMSTRFVEPLAGLSPLKEMNTGGKSTKDLLHGTMVTTRTAEEISEYLKAQPWLYKFLRNCRWKGKINKAKAQAIINGEFGEHTLRAGFTWTLSFEGMGYWKKKNDEFKEWYHG